MPDRDSFGDMRRGKEEEYFKKKEKELIENLKRKAALELERRALAEATGIADEGVLATLQELGYTRETVELLHLVPLVYVAWAEGGVSSRERRLIIEAARLRGIAEGSAAHARLIGWLDHRPEDEFFEKTLEVISALVAALPEEEREASKRDLFSYSARVAAASGGILGIGRKVSDEEETVLKEISASLERDYKTATSKLLK